MNLLRISRKPPLVVEPDTVVADVVDKMVNTGVGAVAVVAGEKPIGIFTERDLMNRVVHKKLSPLSTRVGEVMTKEPMVAPIRMGADEAFEFMTGKHFRHLPVVDAEGKIKGMLSVRHLMSEIVQHLSHELEGLNAYISADGIGG